MRKWSVFSNNKFSLSFFTCQCISLFHWICRERPLFPLVSLIAAKLMIWLPAIICIIGTYQNHPQSPLPCTYVLLRDRKASFWWIGLSKDHPDRLERFLWDVETEVISHKWCKRSSQIAGTIFPLLHLVWNRQMMWYNGLINAQVEGDHDVICCSGNYIKIFI